MLFTLSITACGNSHDGLNITFDLGEFGTSETPLTQNVTNKNDIVFPEIAANDGYEFVEFSKTIDELPSSGSATVTAIFYKVEMWLVDENGDRQDDDFTLQVPISQNIFVLESPKVMVKIINTFNDDTCTYLTYINGEDKEYVINPSNIENVTKVSLIHR